MDNITATYALVNEFAELRPFESIFPHLSWFWWSAIFFGAALIVSLVLFWYFRSVILGMIASSGIIILGVLLHAVSPWVLPLFVIYGAFSLLYFPGTGNQNPTSDSPRFVDSFSWLRYGKRMKRAYASKFGGDNSCFNEEVDLRIAVMRTQGKGETRDMATMWLKNQAQFVEIPWRDISDEGSQEEAT